jgi:hypothetical protein
LKIDTDVGQLENNCFEVSSGFSAGNEKNLFETGDGVMNRLLTSQNCWHLYRICIFQYGQLYGHLQQV